MCPAVFFRAHDQSKMQALIWIFRVLIVLVLVWFAAKNAQTVTIHGLPEQSWQAPLVFVLLVTFVAGVVIGLLAWLPILVRQRREIGRLRRSAERLAVPAAEPSPPTSPDSPRTDIHGI